jgi:hypothetical protein
MGVRGKKVSVERGRRQEEGGGRRKKGDGSDGGKKVSVERGGARGRRRWNALIKLQKQLSPPLNLPPYNQPLHNPHKYKIRAYQPIKQLPNLCQLKNKQLVCFPVVYFPAALSPHLSLLFSLYLTPLPSFFCILLLFVSSKYLSKFKAFSDNEILKYMLNGTPFCLHDNFTSIVLNGMLTVR